jgi:hypothetical protein
MKATISYSVEVEDIPHEIQNLIKDVQWDLDVKLDALCDLIENNEFQTAMQNIESINYNLIRTHDRLKDVSQLISGYIEIVKALANKAQETKTLSPGYPPGPVQNDQ